MKHYETMFIIKPTLVEEEIQEKIEFYKQAIVKNGGVIETCLDMGMRNLAYEIKKSKRGYYFVIYFKASPSLISELERLYRINEDILRFIVIKYESKREQKAWSTLVDRANKKPEPKAKKTDTTTSPQATSPKQENQKSLDSNVPESSLESNATASSTQS